MTTPLNNHEPTDTDTHQLRWLEQQVEHLLVAVEHELRSAGPLGLSELALIKALQSDRWGLIGAVDFLNTERLYPVHFLLFHTLYRLRDQLLPGGEGIDLSPMRLTLTRTDDPARQSLPGREDELRAFYLDLTQYFMSGSAISDMMDDFWAGSIRQKPDSVATSSAADTLGFDALPPHFTAVKQRFRKLVMKAHPDRGGSTAEVQNLNEAFAVLKAHYT
ncbi:DNA-J related domain-containing protein [Marinobacter sp. SS5-14b]|uniref:DNA-J related domain-containing protein n=1 Tax=Marinobacter sp. SS5-14b TaxID=3050456 RepID=UPI0026DF8E3A|nr:DNA-J related domain-containing protein [Marinobacter sp. SS5-14b]